MQLLFKNIKLTFFFIKFHKNHKFQMQNTKKRPLRVEKSTITVTTTTTTVKRYRKKKVLPKIVPWDTESEYETDSDDDE